MSEAILPQSSPSLVPADGAGARVRRYARYIFWLMFLINFINYADRWIFSALGNVIKQQLGYNDFQIGLLGSAFLLVYTLVAFPLGLVADRLSRKNVVAAGVALWSLATAFTALAGSFVAMVFVRALVGIGEGSYYPAGTPMLAAWYPPKSRADVLGRWGVGSLAGAGIGFVIASVLAGPNWRLAFYVTGLPGLLLAFLIWRTREKRRHEDDPPEEAMGAVRPSIWRTAARCLRIPTLRVILAMHALGFFALATLTQFLVIFLGATYGRTPYPGVGLSEGLIALVPGGILLVGGISGNLLGSTWANRLARRRPGARVLAGGLGFLLAAPFVVLTLVAPYILHALPAFYRASSSQQVMMGVIVFAIGGTFAAFFINLYNGPTSAALQDVLPVADRSAGGGLELTLAHLLGDSYAAVAVGALSVALSHALGGEQIGLALLLTTPVMLVASGLVGVWGSRFYARDVAALGASAEQMLGTHVASTVGV